MVKMKNEINITIDKGVPIGQRKIEMVERKGKGHPDSICDGIAEEISNQYSNYCLERYNKIFHHNFDKIQLVAGEAKPKFGGGKVIKPILVQIAGRCSPLGTEGYENTKGLILNSAKKHLRSLFGDNSMHFQVETYCGKGSEELVGTFQKYDKSRIQVPLANDTSIGVGHYPFSDLERIILETDRVLFNSLQKKFPMIGRDFKIMGIRKNNDIDLIIAIAMIDREINGIEHYVDIKRSIGLELQRSLSEHRQSNISRIGINVGDDIRRQLIFLTVLGTSAESGDDGCVGRGNRSCGLFTPYRSMSIEGVPGKNPVSHVGKLYNLFSRIIAETVYENVVGLDSVTVYLLSTIGRPINDPNIVDVWVNKREGAVDSRMKNRICEIVENTLDQHEELRMRILNRSISVF